MAAEAAIDRHLDTLIRRSNSTMKTQNALSELRSALQTTVDALYKRRACDVPESYIEDYVLLDWLQWAGGGLKLTTTGQNVCQQRAAGAGLD